MKHKYAIIDSSKENHNSVDAKFKVQIPQDNQRNFASFLSEKIPCLITKTLYVATCNKYVLYILVLFEQGY